MAKTDQPSLAELQFVKQIPRNSVQIPGLLSQPNLIKAFYPKYQKDSKGFQKRAGLEKLDSEGRGSSPTVAGVVNGILRPYGVRVAVPTDDIYNTTFPLIKDNFYSDLNAFDIREGTPKKENLVLRERLIQLAEEHNGTARFPFRVQDFYVKPDETEPGYGIEVVPTDNFRVIEDERLALDSGTRFNTLDELGMIKPVRNGKHTWYGGKLPLSRVCLSRYSGLNSCGGDLAGSGVGGRVVLVSAEGANIKISGGNK